MTSLNSSSNDPRVEQLRQDFGKKRTRFFIAFAVIEGILLGTVIVLSYGLEIIPIDLGLMLLIGIAFVLGLALVWGLMSMMKNQRQAIRDLTGY